MNAIASCILTSLLACGALAAPGAVGAAETSSADSVADAPITWSATYASWYSFQGLDYSERRPVLQPQLSGTLRSITATAWGNLDQTRRELNEVDLGLQREWSMKPLTVALGYTWLQYPHRGWSSTHELIAELTSTLPFEPSLSVHWDVAAGSGSYWTLGANRELPWRRGAVSLATKLYFHDHYYGMTGFPTLETSLTAHANWLGVSFEPTLARLWTWSNGDFRDDQVVRAGWVLSLACSPR